MTDHQVSLASLYSRFEEFAEGRNRGTGGWHAHEAVLDRLGANVREAERRGWTSCALERAGGMGRVEAFGVRPSESLRRVIPDWTGGER